MMQKNYRIVLFVLLVLGAVLGGAFFLHNSNVAVVNPKGPIASQERDLMGIAILLMLIVVIPVYVLTFLIARRYRASNKTAEYAPNLDHSALTAFLWWAVPVVIISILAVITWKTTHSLDPYKPITADAKPITVQVVALRWKWLFIYPEQHIATVNFLEFPERTPINFELTADDAPMNSFWIPQLGGQMYAMAGHKTQLHLMADETGEFAGSAAEINGSGFSGMKFVAKSTSQTDFDNWVASVQQSPQVLNFDTYTALVEPSENNPVASYASVEEGLYSTIVNKFMAPVQKVQLTPTMDMSGMQMPQDDNLLGSSTTIDTSSWKIYRNEKMGFEFRYPPYLFQPIQVGEDFLEAHNCKDPIHGGLCGNPPDPLRLSIWKFTSSTEDLVAEQSAMRGLKNKKTITVDGEIGVLLEQALSDEEGLDYTNTAVLHGPRKNLAISVYVEYAQPKDISLVQNTISNILSSLKFTAL